MIYLLTTLHVIVCFFLVIVVLLQSGKAADLAGAFGGMGSQTVFGPRGSATALSRATTIAAALFMITSLTLSIMATRTGSGTPTLFDKGKKVPVTATPQPGKGGTPQPGQTVPIQVTPSADGKQQPTQTIPAPVVPEPPTGQAPTLPKK